LLPAPCWYGDVTQLRHAAAQPLAKLLQERGAPRSAPAEYDGDSRRSRIQRAYDPPF